MEDVLDEVRTLAGNGYQEVVLTGIHLSSYGIDFDGTRHLLSLIQAVHQIEGIRRIRLGSLEPGNHYRGICPGSVGTSEDVSSFPSVSAERM